MSPDLAGKRLIKEAGPRLSHVAVLWDAANPYPALVFKETQGAPGPAAFTDGLAELQRIIERWAIRR
jgi:hypothetical protein